MSRRERRSGAGGFREGWLRLFCGSLETGRPGGGVGGWCEANGQTVESRRPLCSVGECCEIVDAAGMRHRAEVIGFRGATCGGDAAGRDAGDSVWRRGAGAGSRRRRWRWGTRCRDGLLNALGEPLDGLPAPRVPEMWPLDGAVPHADGARADSRAAADGGAGAGWIADGGARAAGGNLRRVGRGQEHADRHDDAEHGGGSDGGGAGGGARARGAGVCGGCAGRGGTEAVGGAGVDLGPEPAAADAGGDGGDVGGGVLCGAGEACAAGAGFADAVCDGGAGGGACGGRAAGEQGIYAVGVYAAGEAGGAGGELSRTGASRRSTRC